MNSEDKGMILTEEKELLLVFLDALQPSQYKERLTQNKLVGGE